MLLAHLTPDTAACVVQVDLSAEACQRLSAFGVVSGAVLRVERQAALGGPLEIRIGTTQIMLRRSTAEAITVELPA